MADKSNPAIAAQPPRSRSRSPRDAGWKAEYEAQIRELGMTLEPGEAKGGAERRQFPRVAFPPGAKVYVHDDPAGYEIRDFSAGGLSFFSHHEIRAGLRIVLSAMGTLALQVEVVGCDLEETDADFLDYRYRVRARFTEEVDGYHAFVLAREIFGQSSGPGPSPDEPPR